jgi:hypothetical protein
MAAGKENPCSATVDCTVDWKNSNVYVNLSREAIKSGPEFNSNKLDREHETQLYKHYGQENCW